MILIASRWRESMWCSRVETLLMSGTLVSHLPLESTVNLLKAIFFKKTDSTSPSRYQLLIAPWQEVGLCGHLPFSCWHLVWPEFTQIICMLWIYMCRSPHVWKILWLVVIHCLLLLHICHLIFCNDHWALQGGSIIQMSYLGLSILQFLILCTLTICRPLCWLPSMQTKASLRKVEKCCQQVLKGLINIMSFHYKNSSRSLLWPRACLAIDS